MYNRSMATHTSTDEVRRSGITVRRHYTDGALTRVDLYRSWRFAVYTTEKGAMDRVYREEAPVDMHVVVQEVLTAMEAKG